MTMMRSQQFHNNSHQIPAFGDWEYVNDLPITQYFESARQAGLIRYSHSSGECPAAPADAAVNTGFSDGCHCGGGGGGYYYDDGCNYGGCNGIGGGGDLYAVDCSKKAFGLATTMGSGPTATSNAVVLKKKTTRQGREKKCPPTGKEGAGAGAGAGAGGRKQYYSGGKVCDVTDLRRHYSTATNNTADTTCRKKRLLQQQQKQHNGGMVNIVGHDDDDDAGIQPRFAPPPPPAPVPVPRKQPKAVDEDLYKIPPHLLRSSHRKKKLGFISRCLIPCTV